MSGVGQPPGQHPELRVVWWRVCLSRACWVRGRRFSTVRDFRRRACARLKVEGSKSPPGDTLSTVELSNTSQSLYNIPHLPVPPDQLLR